MKVGERFIFDRYGNLYTGDRDGRILCWHAPEYARHGVVARVGGAPLGMEWDAEGRLVVCVAGVGLCRVWLTGQIERLTAPANLSWTSTVSDATMGAVHDLAIAPDGRIFFSEAGERVHLRGSPIDMPARPAEGRVICYDPARLRTRTALRRLHAPTGICISHNGRSLLIAESGGRRLSRYRLCGSEEGRVEVLVADLPGDPRDICRGSNGTYWLVLVGRRQAVSPHGTTGCVLRIDEEGAIVDSLCPIGAANAPMVTSVREREGMLYLSGGIAT
jgi:sugar lactone lactonase YvrE